jgi:DNA-binding transcriptional ArsR family regulator
MENCWEYSVRAITEGNFKRERAMQQKRGGAKEQELEPLVGLFRLLSDKTRMNILMLLSKGERNVTSLCEELGLPQPTVSHHLGLLRMSNLIGNRRNGKQVFYGLNGQVEPAPDKALQITVEDFELRIAQRPR